MSNATEPKPYIPTLNSEHAGGEKNQVDEQWGGDALGQVMADCLHQVDAVRLAVRDREAVAKKGKDSMRKVASANQRLPLSLPKHLILNPEP